MHLVRAGGDRVGLVVEVRGFYFREYNLRFEVEGAPDCAALLEGSDAIRFRPVIVNGQAGRVQVLKRPRYLYQANTFSSGWLCSTPSV